jgi:hypothetical protein
MQKMKFRVRPGFVMCKSQDEAFAFRGGGIAASHVKPRAIAGGIVELSGEEASALLLSGRIGMLEPLDDIARYIYGKTAPIVCDRPTETTNAALLKSGGRLTFPDSQGAA